MSTKDDVDAIAGTSELGCDGHDAPSADDPGVGAWISGKWAPGAPKRGAGSL
ncbi:MAG: hypothetical protein IV086_07890 [Hyphomonadaceae bacterium]|nr:hypothetical protein [Hyphomonadaceae bacterium]